MVAKRARTSLTPTSFDVLKAKCLADPEEASETLRLAVNLLSENPKHVANALNHLLKKTLDASSDYTLGAGGEYLIEGICTSFWRCVSGFWDESVDYERISKYMQTARKEYARIDHASFGDKFEVINNCWNFKFADCYLKKWVQLCRARLFGSSSPGPWIQDAKLDLVVPMMTVYEAKMIESLLVVVRNLSFMSANSRFIVHSADLLHMFAGCLHSASPLYSLSLPEFSQEDDLQNGPISSPSHSKNFALHTIHTLMNISPHLDVTGRRMFGEFMLMERTFDENSNQDIKALLPQKTVDTSTCLGMGDWYVARRFDPKEEAISKISNEAVYSLCGAHIQASAVIFPLIERLIHDSPNRNTLMATLDLLRDLIGISENLEICSNIPVALLKRLVDLMCVPRLGPDSIDYIDPITNIVTRVNTLKLTGGYDSMVDSDVRDRSLECIEKLSGLSTDMKKRLGEDELFPSIYDHLVPILSTQVGRNDAPQLAGKVLVNLALVPENRQGMMYIQGRLLELASSSSSVGYFAYNNILNQLT